jgi:acetylornithine deacetylase/succinyl-diaminopimelate desuccinylase-like protein
MLDSIKHAAVGSIRYRVTYRGPGGHSWADRGAPSALHGLINTATRFLETPAPAGVSRNLGILNGGTTINTIAAQATLELDLRAESPEPLNRTAQDAKDVFENPPNGLIASVELIGMRPSGGIPADHPLVQAARDARAAAGLQPAKEGASSTDANAAYARHIPAITVGLTTGGNGHRTDEYIDLAPLGAGMQALLHLAHHLTQAP